MKRLNYVIFSVLILCGCQNPEQDNNNISIFNRISDAKDSIYTHVPVVSSYCQKLNKHHEKVDIGGCELYVEEGGKGTPLVLIHGGPGSTHHGFHPAFENAEKFCHVIYYDQRGCGQSDYKPDGGYTIQQAAEDLDNLRKSLGYEKIVVLGHSYGGLLAQYYTIKYPQNVSALVVVCGEANIDPSGGQQSEFILPDEEIAIQHIRKELTKRKIEENWDEKKYTQLLVYNNFMNGDWKRQYYYKPSPDDIVYKATMNWVHDMETNFRKSVFPSVNAVNLKGCFDKSPIPTLIVESAWDLSWSEKKITRMGRLHPNAIINIYTKSGHSPFIDEPEKFFKELKHFIKNIKPVSDTSIQKYIEYLAGMSIQYPDPYLNTTISPDELKAVEEYNTIFTKIKTGGTFFDLSSPVYSLLSKYSAYMNRDMKRIYQIQDNKVTEDNITDWIEYFESTVPWRIPTVPKDLVTGQIWPVYIKSASTGQWDNTLLFGFHDGNWYWWGNTVPPRYWKDNEQQIQIKFLKNILNRYSLTKK